MNDANTNVAIITGASQGLGAALARSYAARGYRLVLTARTKSDLDEVSNALRAFTDVIALAGDVADATHRERLVEMTFARYGRVDVLINNASTLGGSPMPSLERLAENVFGQTMRTNVWAPLRLSQLVLPSMRARGRGVIVNISSDAAVNAYAGWGMYSMSKAALEHASRILAQELEGSGVSVLVIDPGNMNTKMHQDAEPGEDLSALPSAERIAPAVIAAIDDATSAFTRVEAQRDVVSV